MLMKTNKMSVVIKIHRGRNILLSSIVLIIFIIALIFLIKWLKNPEEYISILLRNKQSVFIFSLFGILTILFASILIIRQFIFKKINVIISEEGIYYGLYVYKNKFIYWKDIKKIKSIKYNGNNHIAVFVRNEEKYLKYEKKLTKIIFKLNKRTVGTPFLMYSKILNISFSDFEKIIYVSFENYKKNSMK